MHKEKILIVDDEVEAVLPLVKALELEGYEVTHLKTGESAFEAARQEPFDLVLLDMVMPNMSGYDTISKLQKDKATKYIPVIFMTGFFDEDQVVKGLEAGAVDAITKPIKVSEGLLRAKIRIGEAKIKRQYTPVAYFFSEAQVKEQTNRTGVFEFFDESSTKIGEIFIENGKAVYATCKDAIKEDAFLQLAAGKGTDFMFRENVAPERTSFSVSITSLILEASKLIDEMENKELRDESQKRILIIDRDRIPRILASRKLKDEGFSTMITSPVEISQDILEKYDPHVLVIDYFDCEIVAEKISISDLKKSIPTIIYSSEARSIKDIAKKAPQIHIDAVVPKSKIEKLLVHSVYKVLEPKD